MRAVVVLVLLLVAVGVLGRWYAPQLLAATGWVYAHVGFGGLLFILFLSDAVITPIPPDAILLVISKSELAAQWPAIILLIGVQSAVAGCVAWTFGKKLGHLRVVQLVFGRFRSKNEALVRRYGRWAVALGAMTPIPFSVTCWIAGMFGMRFKDFAPVTLLRVPRFFIYYVAIAFADDVMRVIL